MTPKAFVTLAAITLVVVVGAVFAVLSQPSTTTLQLRRRAGLSDLARESRRGRQDHRDDAGRQHHPGARDRRSLGGLGAVRLSGRSPAGARAGGGARRHAPDRAQDGAARVLRPAAGRGPGRRERQVPPGPPGVRGRHGAGRGDHRQAARPPHRHRAVRHLSAPPRRGGELARERRRADRRGDRAVAGRPDRRSQRPRHRADQDPAGGQARLRGRA